MSANRGFNIVLPPFQTTRSASPDGSVQGFCFSKIFGGTCSGIPQACQPCLSLCEDRTGQQFSVEIVDKNDENVDRIHLGKLWQNAHSLSHLFALFSYFSSYSKWKFWSHNKSINGFGIHGFDYFAKTLEKLPFQAYYYGIRDWIFIRNDTPSNSEENSICKSKHMKLKFFFLDITNKIKIIPLEQPGQSDKCLYKCKENRGCSVDIITDRLISGSIKGSCFPPAFGGKCSGTPDGCQPCLEVCGPIPGEITLPVNKTSLSGKKNQS